jgi:hypothetical protein
MVFGVDRNPELLTKTSILPSLRAIWSKAASTCVAFVTSALKVEMCVDGYSFSISALAASRTFCQRPNIAIWGAPAAAKALAMAAPMPEPPPETTTVLPLALSSVREGSMAG